MAKKLVIAPEAQAALDELTRSYGGSLPARLSIFWSRSIAEGGSVQIPDPTTATGQFEIPTAELADGKLEQWMLAHPALGGSRSYRVQVFLPKPDGTYPPRPNRMFQIAYVDPAENAAAVEASRAAQAAATITAANVAADAVLEAAQGAVASVAARAPPDIADKLNESLSQFSNVMGNVMSTVSRFQTPLQQPAPQNVPLQGAGYYAPQMAPYAPYGMPPPYYGMPPPPMAPPPPAGNDKLADALVALVTAKQTAPPAPAIDPGIVSLLQQQSAMLARIAEKLDAPKVASGPSPELLALQARLEAAERAANEARQAAEMDRREAQWKHEMAELKAQLGGSRPDTSLEIAKLQLAQQAESAKQTQAMFAAMQQQANDFNKELRELASAPAPDQGVQYKQMAQAMGEISNTAMGMMSQAMRMGLGGGGEGGQKRPAWIEPAERMIGILAGMGQSLVAASAGEPQALPPPEEAPPAPMRATVQSEPSPRPRLAAAPQVPQLPAGEEAAQAPAPQTPPPPPPEDWVRRSRQLAQGADFIGAIRTLRTAFRIYPDLVRGGDEIRTVATVLDGIEWPPTTTAEAIEGAYVAVYGDGVREALSRLVAEERARQAEAAQGGGQAGSPADAGELAAGSDGAAG